MKDLLMTAPGGIAKLAFDDMLTILYATDTFYTLIKNVSEKVNMNAPMALLRMVYSADIIYVTQQLAAQKNKKNNMINIRFRTLQHDGSFKWVMIAGNKTEETYLSGTRTVPVYSCIAMDITNLMVDYKKLEQTNDYHNKITELSRELYFDYEIATDTLSFTELFRELFGKDSRMTGFRNKLEKAKIVHPADLPAVISVFNSVMGGRKQVRLKLRLISKEGVPIWYICYASIIFDENRNPVKVVGKLSILNRIEKENELPKTSQLDSLTNVYAKGFAEALITEDLNNQDEKSLSALFLIEIRNYKDLNEIRKSITGENILTTIGDRLKNEFRTTDIIGRLGVNDFIVYMKDIPSDKMAYDKADQICNIIDKIYAYEHTKYNICGSIGIALQKGSQEYQTILANAQTALVMAKKVPTSSFEVFSQTIN